MSTHQNDFEKNSPGQDLYPGNLLDSIPGNVVVIDSNGKVVEVNQNWKNFAVEDGLSHNIV